MTISYNSEYSPGYGMLTFSEVPNILKLQDNVVGTKCTITLFVGDNIKSQVTGDNQYHITLFGETITNVMSPSDAVNKRFYIANTSVSTARNIAKALRNCQSLNADFNIYSTNSNVNIVAKTIGKKITSNGDIDVLIYNVGKSVQDGTPDTSSPSLTSVFNSKINIDVYSGDTVDGNKYVTTLEKNWYGNECAFDMSPMLATLSEYGKTTPYTFDISATLANGEFTHIDSLSANTTVGYTANQSAEYIYPSSVDFLVNKTRNGNERIKMYLYGNSVPYSLIFNEDTTDWTITAKYYDGSSTQIYTEAEQGERSSDNLIYDGEFTLYQPWLNETSFITIETDSDSLRFEVIKPLKAAEYYQRILWRNEYGGISFFDFTGGRSEADSVNIETYEKNIFDYYDNSDTYERKMIFSNDYNKSVTLTSHLMEENGKYIFNSLMKSKKVWTVINDKTYYIIPKTIEVTEDNTYNGIYVAKLTYEYSLI